MSKSSCWACGADSLYPSSSFANEALDAFEAMREALRDMLDWYRGDPTCPATQKAARAALLAADKVTRR